MNHLDLERLRQVCNDVIGAKGLTDEYKTRFNLEMREIDGQNEADYFLSLYDKKVKYAENQNNLLVPYLLGIVESFDIDKQPSYVYGESPDIDIDYNGLAVRNYLKNEWAPKEFGAEKVCNIGSYNTFGIKSSLINMARVFNKSRSEVLEITKQLDLKDDDGKTLTWDKALELYPDLKKYCESEDGKDVAEAARRLIGRNNSMGKHAGGLIVSSTRIDNFVPLVKDKDGTPLSAWVEGLHGQDLGPMGLVKFDLLVITNLMQIAIACKIIKERYGIKNICALPDQQDWSDVYYLDDPKAIDMANKGDLKCIFQFDSQGIRQMAKAGGVTSFNDLVAYTSLYRPGPLGMKMQERYIERKRGREPYEVHSILSPYLGVTYGVLVYQEQVMQILHVVGDIPLKDCEIVRKAISKKKEELLLKYKEMFVINGQKNLGWDEEQVRNLWDQIACFAEYGFNRSVTVGTPVLTKIYGKLTTKKIEDFVPGDVVLSVNEEGDTVETEVVALHDHGTLYGYEVTFDDGYKVTCSMDHKFLTEKGQISLREIIGTNSSILCDPNCTQGEEGEENANYECGWMDGSMRGNSANETTDVGTLQRVPKLSVQVVYDRRMDCTVRAEVQDEYLVEKTSAELSRMSQNGLEDRSGRWASADSTKCSSVRDNSGNVSVERTASKGMFCLLGDEEAKYSKEEHEAESIRRTAEGRIEDSQDNICTTRNTESQSGKIADLAGEEPRRIFQVYRSSDEITQTIQDGNLAAATTWLGYVEDKVWGRKKTGGFCEGQNLDRSGRLLSLQGESSQKRTDSFACTEQGYHVEYRDSEKEGHNSDSSQHGMFCLFDRSDEIGLVGTISEHASITDIRRLVSRKIVRIVPVGKRRMYDLEVACSTHNFLLPNGLVTSNSHACAYTYISSRLLWLKAHYPLEFFAAILSCEDQSEKLKEYKLEAERHGIKIMPVDINKSGVKFQIVGTSLSLEHDWIYFGLSNIKGIGEAVAQRIVDNQKYRDFSEFLTKFGTDAGVVKPLIGLRVFNTQYFHEEPVVLYKYYEWFKNSWKRRTDRKKRLDKRCEELTTSLKEHLPPSLHEELAVFTPEALAKTHHILHGGDGWPDGECPELDEAIQWADEDGMVYLLFDSIAEIHKQYHRSVDNYNKKVEVDGNTPDRGEFNPEEIEIDEELVRIYNSLEESETAYYGFVWTHPLERSPDYEGGMTFEDHRADAEKHPINPVEVRIEQVEKKIAKNKKTEYYLMQLEDSCGELQQCQVWMDDWERFGNDLVKGALARIRVKAPDGGFRRYTMESFPRNKKYLTPKRKEDDIRVIIMKRGPEDEQKV